MANLPIKILLQIVELSAGSKLTLESLWIVCSLFPLKNRLCDGLQFNSIERQSLEEDIWTSVAKSLWRINAFILEMYCPPPSEIRLSFSHVPCCFYMSWISSAEAVWMWLLKSWTSESSVLQTEVYLLWKY